MVKNKGKGKLNLANKVVVIVGPTSSGKTKLGVRLAYHFQGEIVSADSRQVYKGMDIGTGKDLPDYNYRGRDIRYHLIDVASPTQPYNLSRYQAQAKKAITGIQSASKLPIIVGGSGLYVQALIDNYDLSDLVTKREQRDKLEQLGAEKLMTLIEKINPHFASRISVSDRANSRRLSRYLDLLRQGKESVTDKGKKLYQALIISPQISDEEMRSSIKARLSSRLREEALIKEVERLHQSGISYKRLTSFGLEYRYCSLYLQGKLEQEEMEEKLNTAIYRFAKKQKTWLRRWSKQGQKIHYISNFAEAKKIVTEFLAKEVED